MKSKFYLPNGRLARPYGEIYEGNLKKANAFLKFIDKEIITNKRKKDKQTLRAQVTNLYILQIDILCTQHGIIIGNQQ
jgi:hypothetical protein